MGGTSSLPHASDPCHPSSSGSDKAIWFKDTFRPHFDKWVTARIDRLLVCDPLAAILFTACAIDYLACFSVGARANESGYTKFVERYFPKNPDGTERYEPLGLYDSIRNGLVHNFTIRRRKYTLTNSQPRLHLQSAPSGQTYLNAESLRDDFVIAKDDYFDKVQSSVALLNLLVNRYCDPHEGGFLEDVDL